jgi:hypothetical protein
MKVKQLDADEVLARRISLVDSAGAVRLHLVAHDDGDVVLAALDLAGQVRATLGVDRTGPSVALYDRQGRARLCLSVRGEDPCLSVYDARGEPRLAISLLADGRPLVLEYDAQGQPIMPPWLAAGETAQGEAAQNEAAEAPPNPHHTGE